MFGQAARNDLLRAGPVPYLHPASSHFAHSHPLPSYSMRKLFSFLLTLLGFAAQAQVTFKITAVPANTPANATIYMAGTFNSWNPGSAAHALTYNAADGSYEITLPAGTGTIEYKFTRGSWAAVETNATNGAGAQPHATPSAAAPAPVLHQVLNWEDLAGGTAAAASHGRRQRQRHFHHVCHAAAGPHPARVAVPAARLRHQHPPLPRAVHAGRAERVRRRHVLRRRVGRG